MSKYPVTFRIGGKARSVVRRYGAALAGAILALLVTTASDVAIGTAQAEPIADGCRADYSIRDQLTVDCDPGAGVGQHAYIRCTDAFGIKHTHIGTTIGETGGRSVAVCGPNEIGNT